MLAGTGQSASMLQWRSVSFIVYREKDSTMEHNKTDMSNEEPYSAPTFNAIILPTHSTTHSLGAIKQSP